MPEIHAEKFHESTIDKLVLVSTYFRSWLPVFAVSPFKKVVVADMFAGEGFDAEGNPGSPILLLEEIITQEALILEQELNILVVLNDIPKAFKVLNPNIKKFIDENFSNELKERVDIQVRDKDFTEIWPKVKKYIEENNLPSFIFLDQYGVKDVNDNIFLELCQLKKCDFAFFSSSSFVRRFISRPEFSEKFKDIREKVQECIPKEIHVVLHEHFKEIIKQNDLPKRIFPYSIKKGSNYYGLIFGSEHILGIEKIVKSMWDKDPTNGSANFDIYDDEIDDLELFNNAGVKVVENRIDAFKERLKSKLLNKELRSNLDIYVWSLEQQFLPEHARECIAELKKSDLISFTGHSKVSYNAYKNKSLVTFEIKEN